MTNLSRGLPELDARARRRVLLGVWENLGRTVAEMPHVGALRRTADGLGWECEDDTQFRALRDHGGPAILFSGHLANWEIGPPVAASLGHGFIGRHPTRRPTPDPGHAARGDGADAFAHLRRGGVLGMLVDQKLNEGLAVPFFGRPAMTTPALAQFALRFRCPVIPVRSGFRVICEPPLVLPDTRDRTADVYTLSLARAARPGNARPPWLTRVASDHRAAWG